MHFLIVTPNGAIGYQISHSCLPLCSGASFSVSNEIQIPYSRLQLPWFQRQVLFRLSPYVFCVSKFGWGEFERHVTRLKARHIIHYDSGSINKVPAGTVDFFSHFRLHFSQDENQIVDDYDSTMGSVSLIIGLLPWTGDLIPNGQKCIDYDRCFLPFLVFLAEYSRSIIVSLALCAFLQYSFVTPGYNWFSQHVHLWFIGEHVLNLVFSLCKPYCCLA